MVNYAGENIPYFQFSAIKYNTQASANILNQYFAKVGISPKENIGVSPNTSPGGHIAYSYESGIWISSKGGVSTDLNNYNNLISTLYHERLHRENKDYRNKDFSYLNHANVYEKQMSDDATFSNTSKDFKDGIAANYTSYLLGALKEKEIDMDALNEKINTFNTSNKYGIKIVVNGQNNPSFDIQFKGDDNKDKHIEINNNDYPKKPH